MATETRNNHPPEATARHDWLVNARPIERSCYLVGAGLIAAGLFHLGVVALDTRPWLGPLSWRKPVSFGVSFGIALISITWVSSYLRLSTRTRALLLGIFAADCVVEVAGVTVQAWRHVPSHLNNETPFDAAIAYTLAAGGAVLIVVLGSLAATAFRGEIDAPPSMRLALRAGFAFLIAGLASGVAMIVRGERLVRAGHRAAGYHAAGYLKLFHAITLHAILVLPLLAWWLARADRNERDRTRVVAAAVTGYALLSIATLIVSLEHGTHRQPRMSAMRVEVIVGFPGRGGRAAAIAAAGRRRSPGVGLAGLVDGW
jgi:hypothetical protein